MESSYFKFQSSQKIETDYHTMYIKDGIIFQTYCSALTRMSLDVAKKIVIDRISISKNKHYPLLTDSNNVTKFDENARKYFSTNEAAHLLCAFALIVNNPFSKILGNFFLKFSNLKEPTKLFTNQQSALEWIKPFRHLN